MPGAGVSGHGPAVTERRLNSGLQMLPSGRSAYPIARSSEHHKSINQNMPELWSDFSERGMHEGRGPHCERSSTFHGDMGNGSDNRSHAKAGTGVIFVGFAEFDMDGRVHTAGEMDRLMLHASASKYPVSRPATLDEYVDLQIRGMPEKNRSGRDVVFAGPGSSGCELFHTNTLTAQKCVVAPGDPFDGAWGTASLYGRKCIVCVYPMQRVKKQQSLTSFGLARSSVGKSGRLRRAGSLASLVDNTQWTNGDFVGSTGQSQRVVRADQFFR